MKTAPLDCRHCAFCCKMAGYVEVSNYDIRRLAKHLRLSVSEFEEKHVVHKTRAGKKHIKDELTTCQFLGKDHSCTVYGARPTNCRGYVCWDQDDKTVYDFARFMQMPAAVLREKEAEEARQEKEAARKRRR